MADSPPPPPGAGSIEDDDEPPIDDSEYIHVRKKDMYEFMTKVNKQLEKHDRLIEERSQQKEQQIIEDVGDPNISNFANPLTRMVWTDIISVIIVTVLLMLTAAVLYLLNAAGSDYLIFFYPMLIAGFGMIYVLHEYRKLKLIKKPRPQPVMKVRNEEE